MVILIVKVNTDNYLSCIAIITVTEHTENLAHTIVAVPSAL